MSHCWKSHVTAHVVFFLLSGDIHLLVDHFLDIFQESSIFKMQATLIINEIMLGTTGDNGMSLTIVMLNIFKFYTSPHFHHVNLQHSGCEHVCTIRIENSVDPDQMASSEAS